jgi:hypothetical protein
VSEEDASVPRPPNPDADRPARAFWRTGVAESVGGIPTYLCRPTWAITPSTRIATAGSCFAQHITRVLRSIGCQLLDAEPAPEHLPPPLHQTFGYGLYSARYGNSYTARQLRQLAEEAYGVGRIATIAWQKGAAFYDALRPWVEPEGLNSPAEVFAHRIQHLAAVCWRLSTADLILFTLATPGLDMTSSLGTAAPSPTPVSTRRWAHSSRPMGLPTHRSSSTPARWSLDACQTMSGHRSGARTRDRD